MPSMSRAAACVAAAVAFAGVAAAGPTLAPPFALGNAALPDVSMPASGLGTGCAPGGCSWPLKEEVFEVAENMSLSFFALGGRRIDDADSYGLAQGVARAIAKAGVDRSELFIVSKTGPGGLAFPLGYNDTLQQARDIVANYSEAGSVTFVDLLLVHWPVNYGPCAYHGPKPSVPTTDPLCDTGLPTYDEAGCRISSWRGALAAFDAGLARAVGVSNFNSTHIEDIAAAGLRLPSVNQVSFSPLHGPGHAECTPAGSVETCADLLATCQKYNVTFNGYSPFGGAKEAESLLSDPRLVAMGAKCVDDWNVDPLFRVCG
jgi:diketogulonate reductase-like aldo/keto reductase